MAKASIEWLLKGISQLEAQETGPVGPYPGLAPLAAKGRFSLLNQYFQMQTIYQQQRAPPR